MTLEDLEPYEIFLLSPDFSFDEKLGYVLAIEGGQRPGIMLRDLRDELRGLMTERVSLRLRAAAEAVQATIAAPSRGGFTRKTNADREAEIKELQRKVATAAADIATNPHAPENLQRYAARLKTLTKGLKVNAQPAQ